MPEHSLRPYLDRIQAAAADVFDGWAERPYALAVKQGIGIVPNPAQAAAIMEEMDGVFRSDVVILVPRPVLEAVNPAVRELGHDMARFEVPHDQVTMMLLRSLYERPVQTFAVFGI